MGREHEAYRSVRRFYTQLGRLLPSSIPADADEEYRRVVAMSVGGVVAHTAAVFLADHRIVQVMGTRHDIASLRRYAYREARRGKAVVALSLLPIWRELTVKERVRVLGRISDVGLVMRRVYITRKSLAPLAKQTEKRLRSLAPAQNSSVVRMTKRRKRAASLKVAKRRSGGRVSTTATPCNLAGATAPRLRPWRAKARGKY